VAIKVLLRQDCQASWRFVREAAITARLQHPAIVPLYEAGRWTDGAPFFAMKLVNGISLSEAIQRTQSLEDRLGLLPHLVAVLDALAYAHASDVVHGDLKPANVLLGEHGETVVIDWGLAKVLDGSVHDAPTLLPGQQAEEAPPGDATVTGLAPGTPGYMPPEQARGEPVDARADVYALGAMAYHLFSGAAPHRGKTPGEVLQKLLTGPPMPLSECVPELAPDLASIVDKAMSRRPGDRYASAERMAADLQRFTAGQLVSAHSYSITERARRWVRKRRAIVLTAGILVFVLAVAAAVSVRRIVRERNRADAAKVAAEVERKRAVAERDAAERLVQFAIGQLRDRLELLGKLDLLAGLGGEVEGYYRSVASGDDALETAALKRWGVAIEVLADVELSKLSYDVADALSAARAALYERVLARDSGDIEAMIELADAAYWRSIARLNEGDTETALPHVRRAEEVARKAVDAAPSDKSARIVHAMALALLGHLLFDRRDQAAAREAADMAEHEVTELGNVQHGLATKWQERLHSFFGILWSLEWATLNSAGARDAQLRQVAVDEMLSEAQPANPKSAFRLAMARLALSQARLRLGIFDDESVRAATATLRSLVPLDPANSGWRAGLLTVLGHICYLQSWRYRDERALAACRESITEWRRARETGMSGGNADLLFANALTEAADLEVRLGHIDGACSMYREALALGMTQVRAEPDNLFALMVVLARHRAIAFAEQSRQRFGAAKAAASAGLELANQSPAASKDQGRAGRWAALLHLGIGDLLAVRGDRAAAERTYRELLDTYPHVVETSPNDDDPKTELALVAVNLASMLLAKPGDRTEARELLHRATDLLGPLHDKRRLAPDMEDAFWKAKRLLGDRR
jgi:tetratricopeptide (TPR) repeat protein